MGRARGRTHTVVATVSRFNALLGARRGSPQAQAARDVAEHTITDDERENFRLAVAAPVAADISGLGLGRMLGQQLLDAYERGDCDPTSPSYATFVAWVREQALAGHGAEEIAAIGYGDPIGYPGLTVPVVVGLADALSLTMPAITNLNKTMSKEVAVAVGMVVDRLFTTVNTDDYYRRLSPLCKVIGQAIAVAPKPRSTDVFPSPGVAVCQNAAVLMRKVPANVLQGPFHSWMTGFALRLKRGRCSDFERQTLRLIIADMVLVGEIPDYFKPIADAL
jgi:hypothetical protein